MHGVEVCISLQLHVGPAQSVSVPALFPQYAFAGLLCRVYARVESKLGAGQLLVHSVDNLFEEGRNPSHDP